MCACRGTAGFAHVSCLAEQAKIVFAEAEEYNKPKNPAWERWYKCSLCEQQHHGKVSCALGWGCWKTYLERPGDDSVRMWCPARPMASFIFFRVRRRALFRSSFSFLSSIPLFSCMFPCFSKTILTCFFMERHRHTNTFKKANQQTFSSSSSLLFCQ